MFNKDKIVLTNIILIAGLIVGDFRFNLDKGHAVEDVSKSSAKLVVPPLCRYSPSLEVAEAACQTQGRHATGVLMIDGDGINTCISNVCEIPNFTPKEILPRKHGESCFKSPDMNVCVSTDKCVMPPEETNANGQKIQKVGVCKGQ